MVKKERLYFLFGNTSMYHIAHYVSHSSLFISEKWGDRLFKWPNSWGWLEHNSQYGRLVSRVFRYDRYSYANLRNTCLGGQVHTIIGQVVEHPLCYCLGYYVFLSGKSMIERLGGNGLICMRGVVEVWWRGVAAWPLLLIAICQSLFPSMLPGITVLTHTELDIFSAPQIQILLLIYHPSYHRMLSNHQHTH